MQDGVHLFGDRHLDTAGMRQPHCGRRSEDSFRHHSMHPGKNLRQLASAAQFDTYAAIAGEPAGASEHQVAKACESRQGSALPPQATTSRVISANPA